MIHTLNLCFEPFCAIQSGRKTIEMRLNKDSRKAIQPNDIIEFVNNVTNEKIRCLVIKKFEYSTFDELYQHHMKESLGYKKDEDASPDDMLSYYSREDISKFGVVGIEIQLLE